MSSKEVAKIGVTWFKHKQASEKEFNRRTAEFNLT